MKKIDSRGKSILLLTQICLMLLFYTSHVLPQEYIVKNYGIREGLVQSLIIDIFNDPRGFIWIITNEGISRFDGTEFVNFKKSNEFFNTWPERASIDSLGLIYIRNRANQIWTWTGGDFTKLNLPEGYPGLRVASMKIHGRTDLIVATFEHGLFVLSKGEWNRFTKQDGLYSDSLSHVSEFIDGSTYIATSKGICRYINGQISKIVPTKDLLINTILPDKKGNLWITAVGNGIRIFDGKKIKEVYTPGGLTTPNGYVDNEGNLWFATLAGLMRFEIKPDSRIERTLVLDEPTMSISIDKENNISVGTYSNGFYHLSRNPFESYTVDHGLPSNMVYPIKEDKTGTIWAGTSNGITKLENGRWTQNSIPSIIKESNVRRINIDKENNLKFVADNRIYNYDGEKFESLIGDKFPHILTGFLEDESETKWLATASNGIWYNKTGQWEQLKLPEVNPNIRVTSIMLDSQGSIWCCSRLNGLFKITDENIQHIDIRNNLSSNAVIDIDEDTNGNIWTATLGGINEIKDTTVINSYTFEDGLITNTCYAVKCAGNKVYIGTAVGLNVFDGKNFLYFTSDDGIRNNDINSSSFLNDSNNIIWFGTIDGIVYADFDSIMHVIERAAPFITSISTRNTHHNFTELYSREKVVEFEPGDNNVTINFTGIGFNNQQNIFFEYKMSDSDDSWINIGRGRSIQFENLSPGDYTFTLRVKQFSNTEFHKTASITFTMKSYIFQTAWFKLLAGLIILFLAAAVIKIRKRIANGKALSKYRTSSLSKENYSKILRLMIQKVEKEKRYLNPELTLKQLADEMGIAKEHMSEVINKEYKANFNDYINRFRIEEAKLKLLQSENGNSTILEIALAVGFNSKSTFNSAFKKFTGLTPSKFKAAPK